MPPSVIKEPKFQLKGHSYWVRYVTWSPDGDLLATASADNHVRIFQCDGTESFKYVAAARLRRAEQDTLALQTSGFADVPAHPYLRPRYLSE